MIVQQANQHSEHITDWIYEDCSSCKYVPQTFLAPLFKNVYLSLSLSLSVCARACITVSKLDMLNCRPWIAQNISHAADSMLMSCYTNFIDTPPNLIMCHSSLFITTIYTVTDLYVSAITDLV
jgi:hypothetical protein